MLMFSLCVPRANLLSMARLAHVQHETSVHILRIVDMHCAELCLKFFTRPPALGILRLGGLGRGGVMRVGANRYLAHKSNCAS